MRNLKHMKYGVLALTPLLGAGSFAQTFNLGMNNGAFVLAQAPAQSGSYGAMNGAGKPETARDAGAGHAGTPMGGETKLDAPAPSAAQSKTTSRPQAKTQARKVEKKPKDTGTN